MDRLLFVDDEPFVLRALKRTFEMEGFEVVTSAKPAEALEILRKGGEFQVIGSDYRMPEMNGAEFLQHARELAPQSYRLLISAVEEFNAAVDSINRGEIYRFVPKPWNRDDLLVIVRGAIEDYHLRRRYQEMTTLLHSKNAALEALNRTLEERVNERTKNLLDALVTALDQRGAESVHSRRVALLARLLGEKLQLGPEELTALEQGALLHDVGKIGIPDAILLKGGPLSPEEWAEMRRHPEIGYRILAQIPFLEEPRKLVLQHHERWDGGGYPLGLARKDIHICARIFHVAEAYESIATSRNWREARSHDVARQEILRCADTQFDPEVVAAFRAIPAEECEAALAQPPAAQAETAKAPEASLAELKLQLVAGARH